MSVAIFISYSHQDASLVKPVVGLLRATKDLVFQDVDSIRLGNRWREQMEEALHVAHLVILFWCYHSSRSTEVRNEYEFALSTGKHMLPVLLDKTPLPEQLNEFQWVDFRQLVGLGHRSFKHWLTVAVSILMTWFFATVFLLLLAEKMMDWQLAPEETISMGLILTALLILRRSSVRRYRIGRKMAATLQEELFRRGIYRT